MSTVEMIVSRASTLRDEFQQELLRYVDYLVQRQAARSEASDWSRFSASQLAEQYAPGDSIYDEKP
jgi:hypothetical protein